MIGNRMKPRCYYCTMCFRICFARKVSVQQIPRLNQGGESPHPALRASPVRALHISLRHCLGSCTWGSVTSRRLKNICSLESTNEILSHGSSSSTRYSTTTLLTHSLTNSVAK